MEAPPPPDEPPPPVDESGEIGAPRGAPPKVGKDSMPKPPEEMTPEERQIAERLKRGRLTVKCIQASGVRRKDQGNKPAKIDAYLVVQLGDFKKAPRLKTQVRKRSGQNPQFMGESLKFDLVDPAQFVRENDIQITIELWDNNAWNDDLLGEVHVSAVRFLAALEPVEEWLPLTFPGDESSNSKVQVEFKFEEAKVGMAVFTMYEGKNLGTSEMKLGGGVLSPYVSVSMGDNYHKRTQTVVNGGQDPYFGEEQLLMWVDEENWVQPGVVTCWHEDVGDHDVVGRSDINLLPYMMIDPEKAKQELLPLTVIKDTAHDGAKPVDTGELMCKVEFLGAGTLTMHVKSGRNLRETESIGRLDPYVRAENLRIYEKGQAQRCVPRALRPSSPLPRAPSMLVSPLPRPSRRPNSPLPRPSLRPNSPLPRPFHARLARTPLTLAQVHRFQDRGARRENQQANDGGQGRRQQPGLGPEDPDADRGPLPDAGGVLRPRRAREYRRARW
jgi:hypothetical protein